MVGALSNRRADDQTHLRQAATDQANRTLFRGAGHGTYAAVYAAMVNGSDRCDAALDPAGVEFQSNRIDHAVRRL